MDEYAALYGEIRAFAPCLYFANLSAGTKYCSEIRNDRYNTHHNLLVRSLKNHPIIEVMIP